ncbi:MAG: response regulator [Candidatus Eisenbacteria bacterium]
MPQAQARILIADDEPNLREALRIQLERSDFSVMVAADGQEAVEIAQREKPDLVILDVMMPRLDGYSACRQLRAHYRTRHIPIIILTAKQTEDDHVTGLTGGANDYVTKPWKSKELVQRVRNHLEWAKTQRAVSPLTGLPGNLSIVAERQRRLEAGEAFAVMFLDLDNFKAFNDRYGFPRGDTAITAVAEVLVEVIESQGDAGDFVGHIGGDDFQVLTDLARAEDLAEAIKTGLEARMPLLYDPDDRERGAVRVLNRRHEFEDFPLMSVTIAVAQCDPGAGGHLAQVDDALRELKQFGKGLPGSVVVTERRRNAPAEPTGTGFGEPPLHKTAAEPPPPVPGARPPKARRSNAA